MSKTWPLYHNIESITQRKKERDQRRCPIRKEFIGTTLTDALGDSKSRPIVMKKKIPGKPFKSSKQVGLKRTFSEHSNKHLWIINKLTLRV